MTESDALALVCRRLDQAKISYMLTGSFASNFYSTPRMTRDIDIVIEIDRLQIDSFSKIFEDDFYFSMDSIKEAIKHETMFNIIHSESIVKIDFIIRKEAS